MSETPLDALPSAVMHGDAINARLAGRRLAVFLDYDGTLTPIVDRPDLAVLSASMRTVLQGLAQRCTVAIVSGRDRPDVQRLVGLDDLIFAGSHGFDIAGPGGLSIQHGAGGGFSELLDAVRDRLEHELGAVEGALFEPKKASLAVHYRLCDDAGARQVRAAVDAVLQDHPELRVTPGKMVFEVQPRIEWNKGKAVLWLLEALELDRPDVLAIYLGDDITDEDAFAALEGRGLGIYVGATAGEERATRAEFALEDTDAVERFLDALAR